MAQKARDIFDKIQKEARKAGVAGMQRKAREFFRSKAAELAKGYSPGTIMKDRPDRLRNKSSMALGKMYFFFYDAKHKRTLPYWDRFPLTIPIHYYDNGFLGINLHYLHPNTRGLFLSKLAELASDNRMNEKTKMQLTYGLLKGASKLREFRPCIKRYLYSHMRSRALMISAADWMPAIFLPVAQFEKKSEQYVWAESAKIIASKGGSAPRGKKNTSGRNKKGQFGRNYNPKTGKNDGTAIKKGKRLRKKPR